MNRIQRGFTLIELVMVIVIIGILAAIAIPKFVDLSGEANQAAVNSVAGALASAASINYAARKAGNSNGVVLDNCDNVSDFLQGGALPDGYTINWDDLDPEETKTCWLEGPGDKWASFSATGVD